MSDPPSLDDVLLFCQIAESRSLSEAASATGIAKATLSRRLATLEAQVGSSLVHRTSRAIGLTETGRALYERAAGNLRAARAATTEMLAAQGEPWGSVRLSVPSALGQYVLLPHLLKFQQLHPRVHIALELEDRRVHIVREGVDLAVRMGHVADSMLRSRRLCVVERRLVASPAYVQRKGQPKSLAEIASHDCIAVLGSEPVWSFKKGTHDHAVRVDPRIEISSMTALAMAAEEGAGLAVIPDFLADPSIAAKRLVRILPECPLESAPATALFANSASQRSLTRLVLDYLVAGLREHA